MIKRTISGQIDKGDINHNNRKFIASNVDKNRVKDNITIVKDDIKQVYHELFDDALKEFNARQTRKDRIIHDYREHIRHGRQEKEFYEVIFQVGNMEDTPVGSDAAKTATGILKEFTEGFIKRNLHIRVFNAVIHLDEATPHVHIDFVPFATGQKRGLPTRNTLSKALEQQGFKGKDKLETNTKMWIEREKQELAAVMLTRGIEWEQLGTHNEHLSVLDYKKQERQKELKDLDSKTKSAEWVLNQREKLLSDIETTIDRLDGEYQEKRNTIESMDTEIATKQSEVEQVNEKLTAAADQLAEQKALIAESAGKASQIKDINSIETKKTVFGGKITVAAADYDKVSALAKKQIAAESHEKKLNEKISTLEQEKAQLTKEKEELQKKNDDQKKELDILKSIRERLNVEKLKSEIEEWKKKYNKLMEFIESLNLKEQLEKFLHPVQNIIKHKSR